MELKNCPFCGSKAMITTDKETFEDLLRVNGSVAVSIRCENLDCGCEFWTFHQSDTYETAKEMSIERWNHRAEVKESESL